MKIGRPNNRVGIFILVLLALATVLSGVLKSMQAHPVEPTALSFVGEYSADGQPFQTLDSGSRPVGRELVLRGHFQSGLQDGAVPEGTTVNFYLKHLSICLFVNGEEVWAGRTFAEDSEAPDRCGQKWSQWVSTGLTKTDSVEIRLKSFHALGNAVAFRDFLKHMVIGSNSILHSYVEMHCLAEWALGLCAAFSALLMLGVALSFRKRNADTERHLMHWGLMVLLTGLYFVVDADDFAFRYPQMTLGTYVRQVCLMLNAVLLACCVTDLMHNAMRTAAGLVRTFLFMVTTALLALVLVGRIGIMDTWYVWMPAQLIVLLALSVCCFLSVFKNRKQWLLLGYPLLMLASAAELLNEGLFGWFDSGMLMKPMFVIIYIGFLCGGFRQLMNSQRKAQKAEQLQRELETTRVTMALSQIRSHFIFNVLNAISGLCKYDPEKADETVVRFSRYLRSNVEVLENDAVQPFSKALQHLKDYVQLEQLRFGEDKIRFFTDMKDAEGRDFLLPPLLLQPIVENAIQHGLRPLKNGGEIRLTVHFPTPRIVMIKIADNGIGFDGNAKPREGAVGLRNVRFRLETMADGTMLVESKPNVGTTVTMTIRYREVPPCA